MAVAVVTILLCAVLLFLRLPAATPKPRPLRVTHGANQPQHDEQKPLQPLANNDATPIKDCPLSELAHLRDGALDLTETVRYSRRCVRPVFAASVPSPHLPVVRRKPIQMPGRLFPQAEAVTTVNLMAICAGEAATTLEAPTLPECEPLVLDVPRLYPPATGAADRLIFGASSTYSRMQEALDGFAHWLGGSGVELVAVVNDVEEGGGERGGQHSRDVDERGRDGDRDLHDLQALEMLYRARGVQLRAMRPKNRTLTAVQNHFAVLEALLEAAEAAGSKSKPVPCWLGIVDDDTFFPSLWRLDQALQAYNHSRPMWLGALSEDFDSVARWGYMAYGGAGVFLSVPLAQQLAPYMGECLEAGTAKETLKETKAPKGTSKENPLTGDGILRDCIYRHTPTKLTVVPGLYQHDLYGDLSGFYESGVLPLSVHHWRSWYKAPLPRMAAAARLCGDCFLQRWRFADNALLANGYSVAVYSDTGATGVDSVDLDKMEATWSHTGHEFDFSLGPLRPALATGKKSYRLRDVVERHNTIGNTGDGADAGVQSLRQVYVYKGDFMTDEPDEVFELIWEVGKG